MGMTLALTLALLHPDPTLPPPDPHALEYVRAEGHRTFGVALTVLGGALVLGGLITELYVAGRQANDSFCGALDIFGTSNCPQHDNRTPAIGGGVAMAAGVALTITGAVTISLAQTKMKKAKALSLHLTAQPSGGMAGVRFRF